MGNGARDLSWFTSMVLDEQVLMMSGQTRRLSPQMTSRLLKDPGVVATWWTSDPENTTTLTLTPKAANVLDDVKAQLDWWWSVLTEEQRDYLIEHRAGELSNDYAEVVHSAGSTPQNEPPPLIVVLVKDVKNDNRFRLPTVIRAYVEMKARDRGSR